MQSTGSENQNLITLTGVLLPKSWDKSGLVTQLVLATHDEENFVLADARGTEQWLPWLQELVQVRGIFKIDENNQKVFEVKSLTQVTRKPLRRLKAEGPEHAAKPGFKLKSVN